MKRILTTILFLSFLHLSNAQLADQDVPRTARDQVIPDDLIVQGSECVGFDCVNNENFGFMTLILKENNTRIKFFDTSTGTFPANDWILEANESAGGGASHFAILDETGAKVPFKIIAGAPTNSIFVASTGRLGLRTNTPVLDLHINTSNTPGLRLEQNNSGGFTAQTWDIASNEANFFIRDVTNGSTLPFRIRPGAPTSSIDVAANGNVGIGTSSPSTKFNVKQDQSDLHIQQSTSLTRPSIDITGGLNGSLRVGAISTVDNTFGGAVLQAYSDNAAGFGGQFFFDAGAATNADISFRTRNPNIATRIIIKKDGKVGIGNPTPTEALDVTGNIKASGTITPSDRRLKSNIGEFDRGLEEVLRLKPVRFTYNGKGGTVEGSNHIGLIAQDMQEVVPEMVEEFQHIEVEESSMGANSKQSSSNSYLEIRDSEIKYLLINSIKDQQEIIDSQQEQIKTQDERITELEATLVELKNLIQDIKNSVEVNLSGEDLGYLGQNVPNPYQGETSITYVIPNKAQESSINIYDAAGKFVKSVNIKQTGKGQLKINAHNLPGGIYSYQLVIDGKVVDGKKMLLQN